jgi:small-conductance mechanosensitive channel
VACAVTAPAVFALLSVLMRVLSGRARALRERIDRLPTRVLEALAGSVSALTLAGLALVAATLPLALGTKAAHAVRVLLVVVAFLQAGASSKAIIDLALLEFVRKRTSDGHEVTKQEMVARLGVARYAVLLILYSLLALTALQTLGVNVTALIAGLGIGGIAVALAVQNILGDLFASLSIVIDKPFEVGDFIVAGSEMGTVEAIGLKTTRVRSLTGEELIFTNGDLLRSRIRNFKRMRERRQSFTIGVTYRTSPERLREIPGLIEAAVRARTGARFERAHLVGFGASSLDFETVFWVESPELQAAMDIQQAINLELIEAFAARSIEFAYPTQTVFVETLGGAGAAADSGAR